jgi:acetyl esterase
MNLINMKPNNLYKHTMQEISPPSFYEQLSEVLKHTNSQELTDFLVQYAKEHPDEFGIDPERIAVGGQSAGANFSAGICLMDHDGKQLGLKCLVLNYPPLDVFTEAGLKPQPKGALPVFMCRLFDASYCNDREKRNNPLISPHYASVEQVRTFPPTLMITAFFDSLCGEGEQFRDKLVEAGVDVTHKRFNVKHGFNLESGADSDESWRMVIEHLKQNLQTGK